MRKMERTEEGNVISEEKESAWVGKQHILEKRMMREEGKSKIEEQAELLLFMVVWKDST